MSSFLRTGIRRNGKAWVTVLPLGKTIEIASGARLFDAVLLAGDADTPHCGGRARCAVCLVQVLRGGRGLSKVQKEERDRLAKITGKAAHSRLSCQAVLAGHRVTIELLNH